VGVKVREVPPILNKRRATQAEKGTKILEGKRSRHISSSIGMGGIA
jgi:hypothetical protein